jgi:hypothetical protein
MTQFPYYSKGKFCLKILMATGQPKILMCLRWLISTYILKRDFFMEYVEKLEQENQVLLEPS